MARTRNRPLPSGQLGVKQVLLCALGLCAVSMSVLIIWVISLVML